MATAQKIISKDADRLERQKTLFLLVVVILGVSIAAWVARRPLGEFLTFVGDKQAFSAYIKSFGFWGPAVLGLFQILQVVVALLPGHAFVMAAGYIYGLPLGFLLNLSTIVLAGQLAFGIARWLGRPAVIRLAPAALVDRLDKLAKGHGFGFFFFSFLLPVFPADTMNYVAGLSPFPGRKFLLASTLGRSPAIFVTTAIGAYAIELVSLGWPWWLWALVALGLLALYVSWQVLFQRSRSKHVKS